MIFRDLRGWIDALRKEGELQEINAKVDWNCELGTIARKAFGEGKGPAILFNNLKDHEPQAQYGGKRFPPTVHPHKEDWDLVNRRWNEYGFKD